jgi:hypothetical protein
MTLMNLTPHTIDIRSDLGDLILSVPPSGHVARVSQTLAPVTGLYPGVTIYRRTFGEVVGLPEPQGGVDYVVSAMVAAASPREDVFSPGELIRDADGKPVGCKGLVSSLSEPPRPSKPHPPEVAALIAAARDVLEPFLSHEGEMSARYRLAEALREVGA